MEPGQGWYIFIEASSPRHPNDTARLVGPQISDNAPRCLSFYYHMYGMHIYLLNVYMKSSGQQGQGNLIWSMQGTKGNRWNRATINIAPNGPYQVRCLADLVTKGMRFCWLCDETALSDDDLESVKASYRCICFWWAFISGSTVWLWSRRESAVVGLTVRSHRTLAP